MQETVKTQPSSVVTSDLATNITNKNIETLAREEENARRRLEQDRLLRIQKEQEAASAAAKAPSPIDRSISETLGIQEQPVDPIQVEKDRRRKSIRAQVESISREVDTFTAQILSDIENLVLAQE